MTHVALRCDKHRHAFYDTEERVLEVHCRRCSKGAGRPIYHRWHVDDHTLAGAGDREGDSLETLAEPEVRSTPRP